MILAGGLATRLGRLSQKTPKALLPVAGEPFIFHQLRLLRRYGVENIVVCAGYLGEQIQARVGEGRQFGLSVRYSFDWPDLLGTGGAVRRALPLLGETFMVMYGDSYLDLDYQSVFQAFRDSGKPALMTVYRNDDQYDSSNVVFKAGSIKLYDKKTKSPDMKFIDYGLGCLTSGVVAEWPLDKFDLAEIYTSLSRRGELAGYEVSNRFYEIGSYEGLSELDELLRGQ